MRIRWKYKPFIGNKFNFKKVVCDPSARMTKGHLVNSTRKLFKRHHITKSWCTAPKTRRGFPVIHSTFSIFSVNHTHHPWWWWILTNRPTSLTLYKMSKSHLLEISSTIYYFSFLVFLRENWLNRRRVLNQVTPVTLDSSFIFFSGPKSHYYSPKYSNLLIFVHHQ